jgi:hypothetical protein
MQTQFETLVVLLLLVICGALVVIALILQRTFAPTIRQRLRILDDRTAFNIELAEKHGERKLARFALSEAGLAT